MIANVLLPGNTCVMCTRMFCMYLLRIVKLISF